MYVSPKITRPGGVAQIDLSLRMAEDEPCMAGDEPGMAGDCCRADGIQPDLYIDDYVRFRKAGDDASYGRLLLD
jgi:hypothetical protein